MRIAKLMLVLVAMLFLLVGYTLIVNQYIVGPNPIWMTEIGDIIFLMVALSMFLVSFRVRGQSARKRLMIGSALLAIGKFIEMPLKQIQSHLPGASILLYWILPITLSFLGFLFLLFYVEEKMK